MADGLRLAFFWTAVVICAIAELAILKGVFATRRSSGEPKSPIPHSPRGTEIVWGVIPAIALTLLLAATWRAVR